MYVSKLEVVKWRLFNGLSRILFVFPNIEYEAFFFLLVVPTSWRLSVVILPISASHYKQDTRIM